MRISIPAILLACIALGACGGGETPARRPIEARVATAAGATDALARQLAGDAIPVICPLGEDADPEHWTPSRAALEDLQSSRLIVLVGADFEKWVAQVNLPTSRVERLASDFADRWLSFETVSHTHGGGQSHTHEGVDGHVWLRPELTRRMATNLATRLTRDFPEARGQVENGLAELEAELGTYRARLTEARELLAGRALLATYPAYGYLAEPLGCEVEVLAFDPDGLATDLALRQLEERARRGGHAGVLLWPGAPPPELAERIETALGLRSVHFDPCIAAVPDGPGLATRLATGAENLRRALE